MKNLVNLNYYKCFIGVVLQFQLAMFLFSCNDKQNNEIKAEVENAIRFEDQTQQYQNKLEVKTAQSIQDLQGNTYGVTQINEHLLTAENYSQTTFNNGDPIPQAKKPADWEKASQNKEPICCYYNYNEYNKEKYGVYYNWYAINDARGICPKGWQVTPYKAIDIIFRHFDYDGHPFKEAGSWKDEKFEFNTSGFSARPGGYVFRDGSFYRIGELAMYWTSTQKNNDNAFYFDITDGFNMISFFDISKDLGLNVRLYKSIK